MCGIAGAFTTRFTEKIRDLIRDIVLDQNARGPDHQQITQYQGKQCALSLGHNRLKIIDLSDQANQPMWDVQEQYCIVYNGEIYNYLELRAELIAKGYSFKTVSDTEVILNAFKAWGIDAINKFNGPFAFALFDKNKEQLWLVRDRFGVKPLFYYINNNNLYFASSIKIIAEYFQLTPNLEYVARGLNYLCYEDGSDQSPYQNLQALPAAHYLKISYDQDSNLNCDLVRYYYLAERVQETQDALIGLADQKLLDLLLEKLEPAITRRLRADVPVGISLSGGLDSSIIAAMVAKNQEKIIGFSFGHPDVQYSEGPLVQKLAQKIGLQLEYIWPSIKDLSVILLDVIKAQSAPFANLSIVAQYLVYQKVQQSGIKVLLGGQGGDEGFMGYRKFHIFRLQQLFQNKNYFAGLSYFLQLFPLLTAEISQLKTYWLQRQRYLNIKKSSNLCLPVFAQPPLSKFSQEESWQRQLRDITQYSLPTLLRYEDRNSMEHGVESRLPFMDYQMLEFGLALPEVFKLRKGFGKWPLRAIMHGQLPEEIRMARYKRGFDVPYKVFIQQGLGQQLRVLLETNYSKFKDYLISNKKISELFSDRNFLKNPSLIGEVISLLWLGKAYE